MKYKFKGQYPAAYIDGDIHLDVKPNDIIEVDFEIDSPLFELVAEDKKSDARKEGAK